MKNDGWQVTVTHGRGGAMRHECDSLEEIPTTDRGVVKLVLHYVSGGSTTYLLGVGDCWTIMPREYR